MLHDLNLASTYADRVWLLHQGQRIDHGLPNQVLNPATIAKIYAAELQRIEGGTHGKPLLALAP